MILVIVFKFTQTMYDRKISDSIIKNNNLQRLAQVFVWVLTDTV